MLTYLDNSRLKYMENMFEGPPGSIAVWLIFKKYIKFALEIALTIISPSLVLSMPKILVFATCYLLATKATAYWIIFPILTEQMTCMALCRFEL